MALLMDKMWSDEEMTPIINMSSKLESCNFVEEKVKIDRKKFESILFGNSESDAHTFLDSIAKETPSVTITWPMNIKLGTKSKKNLHVKLNGNKDSVKIAKWKILQLLDGKQDRVTMKIDVDWTVHSYIIGKSGQSIRKVMDSTGCHVHFPDSNRNSSVKSNQVSLTGSVEGVLKAHSMIRDLSPVIVSFTFLINANNGSLIKNSLFKQSIQEFTFTQITLQFKKIKSISFITVFIRGTFGKLNELNLALTMLCQNISKFSVNTSSLIFTINREIVTQNQGYILDNEHFKKVLLMQNSETFCSESSSLITSNYQIDKINKTKFIIKSSKFENALKALKDINDLLPITLTFDLNYEQEHVFINLEDLIGKLFHNVKIAIKPKGKQNSKTIWLTTYEKNLPMLFEIRYLINKIEEQNSLKYKVENSLLWPNTINYDQSKNLNYDQSKNLNYDQSKNLNCDFERKDQSKNLNCDFERKNFDKAPGAERKKNLRC